MMADMTRTVVTVDKGKGWRAAFFAMLYVVVILTATLATVTDQRDEARRQALDALVIANAALDAAIEYFKICGNP